jgi:hypothetical protein
MKGSDHWTMGVSVWECAAATSLPFFFKKEKEEKERKEALGCYCGND